jgi:Cu(I)/Ag(I) efflux system protein CusF
MTVKHFAVMAGLWLSVATGAQAQAGSHAGHGHDTQSDTAPASAPVNAEAWAEGEIRKIDLKTGKVTLKHGYIPSLDMPPMTMGFWNIGQAGAEPVQGGG